MTLYMYAMASLVCVVNIEPFFSLSQEPDLGAGATGEEGYYVPPTKGTTQTQVHYVTSCH